MDITSSLRDFFVYYDEEKSQVVGICAMNIIWENLAEIRSLCVEKIIAERHRQKSGGSLHIGGHHAGSFQSIYAYL